ncbi:MAG: peptidoglycan DD-metalloendopeptidase family protein [Parcubacteria group bacterium]|nr:peptidoglycan DD-metalloendopeptidase family protein [Parcubacteria group bacterium]
MAISLASGVFLKFNEVARSLTVDEIKIRIDEKEAEIKVLEAQADAFRKSIDESLGKAKTLQGEIARIDAKLGQLRVNLSITQKKIEAKELKIQELNGDISTTSGEVTKRRDQIGEVLRVLSERDGESLLASMLRANQVSEFLGEYAYLEGLEKGLYQDVTELKYYKGVLEGELDQSRQAKLELQALLTSLQSQRKITENTKSERQNLLAETKNQERNYQKLLQETVQKQEAIEKEIFELEAELRRMINTDALPGRQRGLFYWPLDGGYVTQEFGPVPSSSITRDFYQFHNGIDLGAKTGVGTPIRAAFDGTVVATGNNGRYAYGRWIAVRHENNLTTLYAHLSLVGVSVGQKVSRGQIIGYMGATGLATGPHLHFTVYATDTFRTENRWFGLLPLGGAINPRDYL